MIFICDGLLTLKEQPQKRREGEGEGEDEEGAFQEEEEEEEGRLDSMRRFFKIVTLLHMDLQFVLINRIMGFSHNFISRADCDLAFTFLAKDFVCID